MWLLHVVAAAGEHEWHSLLNISEIHHDKADR
jgi:hypothetical protein